MSHYENRNRELDSLSAQHENLREELEFAGGIISPLDSFYTNKEIKTAKCRIHAAFEQQRLWAEFKGRMTEKVSRCPECIRADLEQVENHKRDILTDGLTRLAGIEPRFANCDFSNYRPFNAESAHILSLMQDYAKAWPEMLANGTSLILIGKPGTGKNHLAVALAKNLISTYQASVFITSVMRIIRAVRRTWDSSEESEESVIAHYTNPDLLIIDEVGIQYGSDSEKITLFDILNTRYERMLPTVLISNLTVDEISGFIGERLTDRLIEGGGATLVFDWPSYRSQKGASVA